MILHRTHHAPDFEGNWAWTPPSGARHPAEDMDACARRELFEETGLILALARTDHGTEDWWVFVAEAPHAAEVILSVGHDRYAWVSPEVACQKCAPDAVNEPLRKVAAQVLRETGDS